MKKYTSAIVGLGQVGQLFDLDEKRTGIWTHFSSYEHLGDRFELIAVCDPDSERIQHSVKRKPSLKTYSDLSEMLKNENIDVISLCTPPGLHSKQINLCANYVKAIICEKPLGLELSGCKESVEICEAKNVTLAVNYYKRFDGCIPQVKNTIVNSDLGKIETATAYYSGPLDAVGSHAINLLESLVGDLTFESSFSGNEGMHSARFLFDGAQVANLVTTGPRESLIFEIDIIGSKGRIQILENCNSFELKLFQDSSRYDGYQELKKIDKSLDNALERFIPMFEEIYQKLEGNIDSLSSSGKNALKTQELLEKIMKA